MDLSSFFQQYPKAAIAFSGGTDSAYLLYCAKKYGAQVQAYYVKSVFQPQFELEDAMHLARELEIPLRVLAVDVLASQTVAANPPDRCYHCKRIIFETISRAA